jgi:ribosomal protein S24E
MDIKIENKNDNRLLKRKELLIKVDYEGKQTVSKKELEAAIAIMEKVDFMNVKASKILSDHGRPFGKAWVHICDEPVAEKLEAQKKADEAKAKEAPAEVKPEGEEKPKEEANAAPAEEKKEEVKSE